MAFQVRFKASHLSSEMDDQKVPRIMNPPFHGVRDVFADEVDHKTLETGVATSENPAGKSIATLWRHEKAGIQATRKPENLKAGIRGALR